MSVQTVAAPDVVAPPPRHPRFPLMDGMRAVAVLAVVLVHSAGFGSQLQDSLSGRLLAHANIGVTIFFLISGFLLYRPFVAHRAGGPPPPGVGAYAKRRVLRIYPAYWLVLTVLVLVPVLPGIGHTPLWPMYTLTQTVPIYHGPSCSEMIFTCGLAQTWSLGAEISFYLALPLYVLVTEALTRRLDARRWALAQAGILAALSAGSVGLQFVVLYPAPPWVGWTIVGNVFWFALGMGLAVASVLATGHPTARRRLAAAGTPCWAVAIGLYVALSEWLPATPFLTGAGRLAVTHAAFGVIALCLLVPAVFGDARRRIPARVAGARPMAWLGLVSYGIFLWHFPLLLRLGVVHGTVSFLLLTAAVLALSCACAAVSYYLVERPLMKLKYRRLAGLRVGRRAGAVL